MEISYSVSDLLMYLYLYSFIGWAAEVVCFAIRDRQFVNRGVHNVPFLLPYGITAVILILVLPTLDGQVILQYLLCFVVYWAVKSLSGHFTRRLLREPDPIESDPGRRKKLGKFLIDGAVACFCLVMYLVVHPLLFVLSLMVPELVKRVLVILCGVTIAADFVCVVYALRTNSVSSSGEKRLNKTRRLANRLLGWVRARLEKNYPGILQEQTPKSGSHVFARGMCLDKLLWVFLVSSFMGALIEMVFCRITGGEWMNRSSVLYGTFSFVWGLGAVILTITLQPLMDKADRYVFLAGFVVGGAYEYLCSVFTELVFGTVFWDYSDMPLNIGGRTNVLYCIFWGILAVFWVKMIYPPMSRNIEKIPALPGKIVTWVLVVLLICDGLLTAAAMTRYTQRQEAHQPENVVQQFLDTRYDDSWMENRWPNMVVAEQTITIE